MLARLALLTVVSLLAFLLPTARASAAAACTPGAQISCPCIGGGSGAQVCSHDGTRYEQCVCAPPVAVLPPAPAVPVSIAPAEPPVNAPPLAPPPAIAPSPSPDSHVEVVAPGFAPGTIRLQLSGGGKSGGCVAPCSVAVPPGTYDADFEALGRKIARPVTITPTTRSIELSVRRGWIFPAVAAIGGGVGTIIGASLIGAFVNDSDATAATAVGAGLLAVGVGVGVGGGIAWFLRGKDDVQAKDGTAGLGRLPVHLALQGVPGVTRETSVVLAVPF